jgi:hypothetical protein
MTGGTGVPPGVTDRIPTARQLGDDCDPRRQARQMAGQMQVEGSTIPPGIVVWWTGTKNAIPFGWGLMDGVHNSSIRGGTGLVLVDRFILASDSGAGKLNEAEETTGGGAHDHQFAIAQTGWNDPEVTGSVENSKTNVVLEEEDHDHGVVQSMVPDNLHTDEDGAHMHAARTDEKEVEVKDGGEHKHNVVGLETNPQTIANHTSGDIRGAVGNHGAHVHDLTTNVFNAAAGGQAVAWMVGQTGPDTGESRPHDVAGAAVTHDEHEHTMAAGETGESKGHTHPTEPHDHKILFQNDGEHFHAIPEHQHELTLEEDDEHTHEITDPGHSHDIITNVSPHNHGADMDGEGEHEHITGKPVNILLLPIEKLRT